MSSLSSLLPSWFVTHANAIDSWAAKAVDPEGFGVSPSSSYTRGMPFTEPSTVAFIATCYIVFVVIGSITVRIQAIPAFKLSVLMFLYNPIQIMLCSYMCIESAILAYRHYGQSMFVPCLPFNRSNPVMANVLWLFYVSKILDFFDTIFIVFGKKKEQLSFLHCYHHVSIFVIYYFCTLYGYDGDIYLTICLNSFVHTLMYLYYTISVHGISVWWKKYVTLLQLVQFVIMNVQAIVLLWFSGNAGASSITGFSGCVNGVPLAGVAFYLFYIQSLFWLFLHFFSRSYKSGNKSIKNE